MSQIRLTRNKITLVDKEDFNKLMIYKWCISSNGYAVRSIRIKDKTQTIYLHKQIRDFPKGDIDHINGNKLDNRRENLRSATRSQNIANSKKKKGTSKYKGVHWDKQMSKWRVTIRKDYKHIFIGLFKNEIAAAMAYDITAKNLFGEFARLNFSKGIHG